MYKVYDNALGRKIEIGCFNTLAEAETFRDEAARRINGVMDFLGKRTTHIVSVEEEARN